MTRMFPLLLWFFFICVSALDSAAGPDGNRKPDMHLKFDNGASEPAWTAHNDNVMGGVSKGGAVIRDGVLSFTGSLSFENNGGFAQIRIQGLGYDLSGKKGFKLRVMGDGRTYQLRLATDARHRGSRIAYSMEFSTKAGEWAVIETRFADLKASHRGKVLEGPPADLSQVEEMSFFIADKREGAFSLQVDWMKAE